MKVKDIVESVGTLSHKSTRYDDPSKSGPENKRERDDIAYYKREILANFDKKMNDDIFHGKMRLYIPISSDYKADVIGGVYAIEAYRNSLPVSIRMKLGNVTIDRLEMIEVFRDVQKTLIRSGYEMSNYIENEAVKKVETQRGTKEQKTSISKVLAKAKDQNLIDFFNNDPVRTGSSVKDVQVVISRHPHDIAGMSTHRSWDSCMNLRKGLYREKVPHDIKFGTIVAYLIDKKDRKVENPKARIAIKPFINSKDPTDVALGVEARTYGQANESFMQTVVEWANEVNSKRVRGKGKFVLPSELYRDSHSSMLYGIKNDYPPDSIAYKLINREIDHSQVDDDQKTPDVINALLDLGLGGTIYGRIPAMLAEKYHDGYVKVLVSHLNSSRTDEDNLSIVSESPPAIQKDVLDQVFGNNPFTPEEHDVILHRLKIQPNSIALIPRAIITPAMVLLGLDSPYMNTELIQPKIFYQDPETYFDILDKCNIKKPYMITTVYNMPKDVWFDYANRARKCFLDCLYNETHIKSYFELIKSVTSPEIRHQVVEYIFQYKPSEDLVQFWREQYLTYVTVADFDLIPDIYMIQFLPEMSKAHPGYLLGKLPDSLFNTHRQLYDQLVKNAVDVDGPAAVYYLKNEKILDHYRLIHDETQRKLAALGTQHQAMLADTERKLAALRAQPQTQQQPEVAQTQEVPKPQVESIDRIKQLAGYKTAILK